MSGHLGLFFAIFFPVSVILVTPSMILFPSMPLSRPTLSYIPVSKLFSQSFITIPPGFGNPPSKGLFIQPQVGGATKPTRLHPFSYSRKVCKDHTSPALSIVRSQNQNKRLSWLFNRLRQTLATSFLESLLTSIYYRVILPGTPACDSQPLQSLASRISRNLDHFWLCGPLVPFALLAPLSLLCPPSLLSQPGSGSAWTLPDAADFPSHLQ